MEHTPQKSSVRETVVLAISSIGIGAYCASFSSNVAMQAVLMSLPPATLFISQRRKKDAVAVVDTPRHTAVEYLSGVHAA
ncbi:unannotated protein [freshwater metagenome]|uniref:Unannotated protein n=1 Tax=freshwater metagenome TaxID=449393 RepID=A0A6J6L812_9ZZZZ|nr:hypothetical protein [Actinomycetota bacterium]